MSTTQFCLFDTAIGWCGLVWGAAGVVGFQLPEADLEATRARLRRRFPEAQAAGDEQAMDGVIARVRALLEGADDDLADLPVDLSGCPEFARGIYAITRAIRPGETMTYGEITRRLGAGAESARAVGQALGANPAPVIVPCHRVTAASGKTGGFSAPGGVTTKLKLLAIEARHARDSLPLFS